MAELKRQFSEKDIRIAAFDLDGTVLNQGCMSDAVGRAIDRLTEKGIAVAISTGRDISQIPLDVFAHFSYFVTANGAIVTDSDGNTIFSRPMDPRTTRHALKILHENGGKSCIYLNGFVVVSPLFLLRLLRRTNYLAKSQRKATKDVRKSGMRVRMRHYIKKHDLSVYRIQTFFKSMEEASKAAEMLRATGIHQAVLLEDKSIETTADGITKANGLLRLCEHLGCGPENIIAFGDSANDLEMLSESGYSVGMGNAESCVKEMADYITDTVENDGVATAIRELFQV
ncbi:MAG: HAD family hydrolase [Spirochaetales bacterium]|nr:HAD family hydrolase [Spirochaetales bacterium]MBQ9810541.1 HAD family hydrolase [Spirochaetales bacterium]